jgi:hypothetical protein
MEKFKLGTGEVVIKKGGLTYWPPETKEMGALKAAFRAKQCVGFLTSSRMAACTKVAGMPFGPLIWLISWLMGRKIYFEVALEKVAKVEKSEDDQYFVITADDGTEYRLAFDAFFDPRDQWLQAFADAIAKADANANIHQSGNVLEVSRS